jgi:hypothetical protein
MYLSASVTTIDSQVGSSNVLRGIGEQEGDGTHQIDGRTHLALGDEGSPLSLQLRVIVENLLSPASAKYQLTV